VGIDGEKGKRTAKYWRLHEITVNIVLESKVAIFVHVLESCMSAIYW